MLSGQVGRGSSEIEGQLRALSNTVAPLVGGDWAGQAQQRFTALWDEWQRSAQGLQARAGRHQPADGPGGDVLRPGREPDRQQLPVGAGSGDTTPSGHPIRLSRMTRTVVTGGAGFLGSHLCERLLAEGTR
jgi:hypothetical protein